MKLTIDHVRDVAVVRVDESRLMYPLLSDFWPHGQVAQKYGVLRSEGYGERALFIIDRTGIIRYVDVHNIDEQPDNEVLFCELAEIEGVPRTGEIIPETTGEAAQPAPAGAAPEPAARVEQVHVVVYCTDWLPACRRARAYLKVNDIPFEEVNITRIQRRLFGKTMTPVSALISG